jgi:hypothetical protein
LPAAAISSPPPPKDSLIQPLDRFAGPFHDQLVLFADLAAVSQRLHFRSNILILPRIPDRLSLPNQARNCGNWVGALIWVSESTDESRRDVQATGGFNPGLLYGSDRPRYSANAQRNSEEGRILPAMVEFVRVRRCRRAEHESVEPRCENVAVNKPAAQAATTRPFCF